MIRAVPATTGNQNFTRTATIPCQDRANQFIRTLVSRTYYALFWFMVPNRRGETGQPVFERASLVMAIPGYNVRKAAQVTAFFAKKEGGAIEVLKVAKLLYLAD